MTTAEQRRSHWQQVWTTRAADSVSWFESRAVQSLELIFSVSESRDAAIIDVGGGASVLVDGLVAEGFANVTVLDVSSAALAVARVRLGVQAERLHWVEADVLTADFAHSSFDVWHDRAVFHFLTDEGERVRYVQALARALKPGGHALIACFALDGPMRCSGLPVVRYDAAGLAAQLGPLFQPVHDLHATHSTPGGSRQSFLYTVFRYCPAVP